MLMPEILQEMRMTRIAFIADIHHGRDVMTKKSSLGLPLLARFADFVRQERPDIVIDLGDRISDENRERDLMLEREVAEGFKAIDVPVFHLNGNHDRDFLEVADNEQILGQSLGHQVVDLGKWQVILWRADTHIRRLETHSTFRLADGDLEWLAAQMKDLSKPTVIATHVPLSGQSQTSNYYFENNPHIARYPETAEIQAVLRSAKMPVICISGHVHWNTVTFVDGIPHVTLQSLTETFTTAPDAAEAWGMLELGDMLRWSAFGRQRFGFEVDAASTARRWPQPHGNFHEMRKKAMAEAMS
jgi:3',5'-cyclic-AMP phosphodiesterase